MAATSKTRASLSGVGAVLMTVCAIAPFAMMSLYMGSMAAELSVTVGQISLALSIATLGSLVGSLTIGRIMKIISPKIMIVFAGLCIFAFQLAISVSNSLVPIYIVAFFNGFGTTWGGIAMAQIIITLWFAKGQGTMMSVCMVVMGLAMVVAIPIIGSIVATAGYRPVVLAVGIIAGAGVILSAFLISGAPAKYGLQPLGAAEVSDAGGAAFSIPSLSWGKILKNPTFWAIWAIVVLATIAGQGFSSQAAVIFGSLGLDAVDAAFAFSLFTLMGIPLQFVFGLLCDRIGPKIALYIFGAICAVVLVLSFLWAGWVGAIILACGMAFGGGLAGLYGPNAAPRIFGPREAGDMIGFIIMGSSVGATIGPISFGLMYDAFGNYVTCLIVMGVLLVLCLLLNFWIYSKKNLDKIKQQIADEAAKETAQAA
jgi:MFS family permease